MRSNSKSLILFVVSFTMMVAFNNCGEVTFVRSALSEGDNVLKQDTGGPRVPPPPLVQTVGVVTVLLALGDQVQQQLVVNGESSRSIAETAVRYSSPESNPRILVVRDRNNNGETFYDTDFILDELLANYDADLIEEPVGGLLLSDVISYDLVWFNNPGYPMGLSTSRDTLLDFDGGVVLSGDDLSRGNGFSLAELTGLTYINNGTSVKCGGKNYPHDNNKGYQYNVRLLQDKLPDIDVSALTFRYGNDIDLSEPSDSVEVIAEAKGGADSCEYDRPVIVRYEKTVQVAVSN